MSVSFIILASMPIRSMKSLGSASLLKYKKQTIIEKHIDNIISTHNKPEIVVVGGFENKKIAKVLDRYSRVKYISHEISGTSNEAQSLFLGLENIKHNKAVVFSHNCIFDKKIWHKINTRMRKSFMVINNNKNFETDIGATINDGLLEYVFFNLKNKSTGIYCLNKKHISYTKELASPRYHPYYMFEMINLMNSHEKFTFQEINTKKHIIIDSVNKYNQARGM